MVFSSTVFLCGFLPLFFVLYYLCPAKLRNGLIFAASLLFYAYGEPKYILIMLFSTFFDYGNGRLMEYFDGKQNQRGKKAVLICSVIVNIGLLCFFKYTDFALENLDRIPGISLPLLKIALPLGISFYTFQTLSYTIDVYRGEVRAQHSIIRFGMYISMFPQLIAGPIVRYQSVAADIDYRTAQWPEVTAGIQRFIVGLTKKALFANFAGALWEAASASRLTVATAWLGAIAYALQIYYDFSGYSDMAIGLGSMMGFHFPENFNYPYLCTSVTDFWRRWHMTLCTWFREYVYIPLGGNRKGRGRQICNLLIVWLLTGLWHGAGWNFVAWGLYYFLWLSLEKLFLLHRLEKLPDTLRHLLSLAVVLSGWMLFAGDSLAGALTYLSALFGGAPLWNSESFYLLYTNGVLLVLGVLGCTPLPKRWAAKLAERAGKGSFWLRTAVCGLLLALSVMLVVSSDYNPFLYFRF